MSHWFSLSLLGLGALALAACASDAGVAGEPAPATATAPVVCDPLAPKPITLGAIVGVGVDGNGTSYVDAANGVFVAAGNALDRQHVLGTGQAGDSEYLFQFAPPSAAAAAQTLLVETDGAGVAQAMALDASNSRAFLNQADAANSPLTLVDPSSISQLPVVNTPNLIDYVGDVANGNVVLATVPMNRDSASESGGLSLFYGPPDNVEERQVTAFEESLSGNGTLTFLIGTESYVLAFGTVPSDSHPLGDFTLQTLTAGTGTVFDVTLRSPTPSEPPAGLSFTCLR